MDRRRGAQGSPAVEDGDRARKRRKQSSEPTAASAVSAKGDPRTVFDAVWNYQERSRNIRQYFEELPSKDHYPDYYTKITNPISLKEIKAKLDRNEYAGASDIKADLLLMCENATTYNKPKSKVHSDALRLRKLVETFEDPSNSGGVPEAQPISGRNSKALRQAMAKLVDDMLALKNDKEELVSQYFKNLPSKKLYGDYYRLIKKPISLTQIQKRAKEGKYHGWSDFEEDVLLIRKNAEEYNAPGSEIIKDARELEAYFLKKLPEEKAKISDVPSSSGIKLRLNMSLQARTEQVSPQNVPKIKLNVGGKQPPTPAQAPTPAPAPAATPAMASPTPQPTPQPTSNGASHNQPPPPPPTNIAATQPPVMPASAQPSIPQPSPAPPGPNYHQQPMPAMPETPAHIPRQMAVPANTGMVPTPPPPRGRLDSFGSNSSHSPRPGSIGVGRRSETPHSQAMSPPAMMPPAQRMSATPRPPSFSPVPAAARAVPHPAPTSAPQLYVQPAYQQYQEPTIRAEGKDKSDALITHLSLTATSSTNPAAAPFVRKYEPDDRKVTVQYYVHLPVEYDTIQIACELPSRLTRREFKFKAMHSPPMMQPRELAQTAQTTPSRPVYNLRMAAGGVNTIEVTAVTKAQQRANGVNGFAATSGVDSWEMERFRVFISPLY